MKRHNAVSLPSDQQNNWIAAPLNNFINCSVKIHDLQIKT